MTRDEIIRMAREAGLRSAVMLAMYGDKLDALTNSEQDELEAVMYFATLVAAAEREAVIAAAIDQGFVGQAYADDFSRAMRARSNT